MNVRRTYVLTFVTCEIVAFLVLVGGCGLFAPRRGSGGFNHTLHTATGLTCDSCHYDHDIEAVAGMPSYETCFVCHGTSSNRSPYPYELDLQAHPPEEVFAASARFHDLKFSHAVHEKSQVECSACHDGTSPGEVIPPEQCDSCHRERAVSSDCALCHNELRKDRRPRSHQSASWRRNHGRDVEQGWATGHENSCSLCHTQSSCDSCHQVEKPRNHTEQFRQRGHGILVGVDREQCSTCHQESFCVRCHKETEPRSHRRAGWGGSTSNHCFGCHEPVGESRCSVCHEGAPSHLGATQIPAPPHPRATSDCYQCHLRPPHADNRMPCTTCHK